MTRDIPLRRFGKPSEVADMCVYLLSDEFAFVTGAEFAIDGGLTARRRQDQRTAGSGCPGIRSYGCFQPGSAFIRSRQAAIAG